MAGYTGSALYLLFSGTTLSTDYRAFSDSEEIGMVDQSAGADTERTYLTTLKDGTAGRRQGVMLALIEAAMLGQKFVYTLQGRRLERAARPMKSLDELLVAALRARGVNATYVPLKEYLK